MVRCGNDSATCLITPAGEIIWSLAETLKFEDGQPFRRGAGAATITVNVPSAEQNKITFYSRYRDWIVGVAAIIWLCGMLSALIQRVNFLRKGN
jgi:apolipoprotein N-acyltransferase